jgi:large subunit ribosomal protein L25
MAEELSVEKRDPQGKLRNRRLRKSGRVPAVLYGHGEENVSLSVPVEDIETVVRRGSRLVNLTGAVNESAFIRELQWDTWGTRVLHVDFTRISADESVEVEVAVELRGEAPGVREGGIVEQLIHQVALVCRAASIPDKIWVNVNALKLGGEILLADLDLPEGVAIVGATDEVVVHCIAPVEVPEEAPPAEAAEPEVIGAKEREETEES